MRSLSAEIAITLHSGRTSIGRLFVRPPSTRERESISFGVKTPGSDIDARTAFESFHSERIILSPVLISVAITWSGIFVSEKFFPSNNVSRSVSIFFHLTSHWLISGSIRVKKLIPAMISFISQDVFQRARRAQIMAHILVPAMDIGLILSSSSFWITQMCASPRAPPPPSANENGVLFFIEKRVRSRFEVRAFWSRFMDFVWAHHDFIVRSLFNLRERWFHQLFWLFEVYVQ